MTANMTNRDAKGKFVKAPATQTFNVGDRVICPRLTGHGTGTVGKSIRLNSPQFADIRTVRVVWDTGGESHYTPAELQPAPAPCPFKVGDRVVGTTARSDRWPAEKIPGRVGVITSSRDVYPARGDSDQPHGINWPDGSHSQFGDIDIDHAPEEDVPAKPEANEGPYLQELRNVLLTLRDATNLDECRKTLALYKCERISQIAELPVITRRAFVRECLAAIERPKVKDGPTHLELLTSAIGEMTKTAGDMQQALSMPGASWPEMMEVAGNMKASTQATIEENARLKAELARWETGTIRCIHCLHLTKIADHGSLDAARIASNGHSQTCPSNPMGQEIANLKLRLAGTEWNEKTADRRAEAAEAKLADIAALTRAARLINAMPQDEPTIPDTILAVLEGAVAA